MTIELYECESCSAKSGSPALCVTCLENRARAGGAWKGPRRHFAVPEAIVGQMPMPTAYDRDQQALRDRLDAALRRIEQLEADVARLKGPQDSPMERYKHALATDPALAVYREGPQPTFAQELCQRAVHGPDNRSRSQVDMRAEEYGANGTPLPDEGT